MDSSLNESFIRTGYVFDLYDGDTVYYHTDLGYDVWATFLTGRLLDIQAAEIRPLVTREEGKRAKQGLSDMMEEYALNRHMAKRQFGWEFRIRSLPTDSKWIDDAQVMKKGKFGRWLIQLLGADDHGQPVNLNDLMVQRGLAQPYK